MGAENQKRLQWPLAKIIELIPGRDGLIRTARVKTQQGVLLRPLQRSFPLELTASEEARQMEGIRKGSVAVDTCDQPATRCLEENCPVEYATNEASVHTNQHHLEPVVVTRSGRKVYKPRKLKECM